jgi:hypothetical protein
MFVQPRTSAKLKNRSLGKTMSSQPIAKPFVNCRFFFAFCVSKNLLKNSCQITGKCLLKINVQNIFGRKKELAVNGPRLGDGLAFITSGPGTAAQ